MAVKLKVEDLYKHCDPDMFKFKTTDDVPPLEGTLGQERALRALDFGISLEDSKFNIFLLGEDGTGKMSTIKAILSKKSLGEPVPSDWCYVYNFKDPDAPIAISLEPGRVGTFQKDMDELVKILKVEIPKVFDSKEYDKQKNLIVEGFQKKQKDLFSSLEDEAKAKGFAIRKAVSGLLIVPIKKTGEPLNEEEFDALETSVKKRIDEIGKSLQEKLDDVVRNLRDGEKLVKEMLAKLEREAALSAVGHLIDELKNKYSDNEKIIAYFDNVREDVLAHLDDFKTQEE